MSHRTGRARGRRPRSASKIKRAPPPPRTVRVIWGSKEPPEPEAGGARSQNPPVFFIPAAALGESRSSARSIGVGELSAEMEWLEKNLQENFDLPAKHPSEEALRRWRSAVSVVRNPRRRFRMVADLVSRSQNEARRRSIQVLTLLYCLSLPLTSPPCSGLRLHPSVHRAP